MKNFTLITALIFIVINLITAPHANASNGCTWKSWFKYPKNNTTYEVGSDIYCRVDPQKYHDIREMQLFINGKYIRKESQYPFEWAKGSSGDHYLRNMKAGTYKLKCRIKDKCGRMHEIYCTFIVKGQSRDGHDQSGQCQYKAWFKYPQNGKFFNTGSSVYVRLDAQNQHAIKHVELYINGKFIRKENSYPYEWAKSNGNSDSYLRNLTPGTYKLKARVYDKCGKYKDYYATFYVKGGGNQGDPVQQPDQCKYKSWFKYPKNNGTYRYGSDVYVRIDTEKYQDIKEMHLYVNQNFIRKETSYPYEWCKGSGNTDSYLRNLKRGTYNLKARVQTKCGKWYEYFCKFYVR